MTKRRLLCAAVMAGGLLATLPAAPADPDRGRALYELRCQGCHSESVHARTRRVAADFHDVQLWVARWNATLSLRWSEEEIDDVAVHLNNAYYRFPCPPTTCKVVSMARTARRPADR